MINNQDKKRAYLFKVIVSLKKTYDDLKKVKLIEDYSLKILTDPGKGIMDSENVIVSIEITPCNVLECHNIKVIVK